MSDEAVIVDDGMGGDVPVEAGSSLDPFQEWASNQPADVQERLDNAGVRDFDHLARTWNGAEDARQRLQSERDRLMSQFAEEPAYQQQYQDQPMYEDVPGMQIPGMDELLPLFGHDEARVMDFITQQRIQESEQRIAQMLDARLGEYLAPIQQQQTEAQLNDAITEARNTYGEMFDDLAPDVVSLINQFPEQYNSPQGVWSAFGLAHATRNRESAMQDALRSRADTIQGGASRAPQTNAADEILKRIEGAKPMMHDGLS
jgi:hypothetical protein